MVRAVWQYFQKSESVVTVKLQVVEGRVQIAVCACVLNGSLKYSVFLDSMGGLLEGVLPWDSIVFPENLKRSFGQCCRHLVTERKNSGVLLVDFCARHRLT